MTGLMLNNIQIKKDLLQDEKYTFLFSVEEVNKLVLQGMPFRDAYKKVAADIESGNFTHSTSPIHTHEGSIGNLCNDQIQAMMQNIIQKFDFDKVKIALQQLLS
jgi:argininosuccinate lyase